MKRSKPPGLSSVFSDMGKRKLDRTTHTPAILSEVVRVSRRRVERSAVVFSVLMYELLLGER